MKVQRGRWLLAVSGGVVCHRWRAGPPLLRLLGLVAVLAGLLLVVGCRGDGTQYLTFPQTTLEPTTEYGWKIQNLFELILAFGIFVFILVAGILLYTIWRFRARPGEGRPRQVHGNTKLEIAWTIAPTVILAIIAVPTVETIFAIGGPAPADALRIEVIGHQWWWEFRYPDYGVVTANELHIPTGRNVSFDLKSADVIHSFWFPRLGGKRDVVPNHTNHMWFMAERPDMYLGQCAEYCGTSHANMRMRAFAESPSDFEAWIRAQQAPAATPTTPEAQRGAELFQRNACVGCHTIAGTNARGELGPNLTHVGSRTSIAAGMLENTPENMVAWISDPQAVKPGALMPKLGLPEEDIRAIVAYLESLK